MTDATYADQPQASAAEEPRPKERAAKRWHDKLKEYRESIGDKWEDQCKNLDKLYSREDRADSSDREYSIFWANIEVLRAAVYARTPVPVVAPRFKGGKMQLLASSASEMLERCLVTTFEQSDIDGCLKEVRDEFLRYARGSARARIDKTKDGKPKVAFDHFTATDFSHDPKRTWREVDWIGFRAWMNLEDGKARFDESLGQFGRSFEQVPRKKRENQDTNKGEDQAPIWEIWCKKTGLVHFVCEDYDIELDTQEPWLDLSEFWPCPRPAFGTTVPKKLKPVPDIRQYKDQIEEINEYTARISSLAEHLRLKGFYPAGSGELSDAIEVALKSTDNRAILIPVSSYASLGNTSFKDSIVWIPFAECVELIKSLVELRRVVIDDVYQITGISDILRGDTEASETATAQQIKSQWGSARIRDKQTEIANFARDLTRMAGEIIAENFEPQDMAEMSQMGLPSAVEKQQAQQTIQQAQAAEQQAQQAQQSGQEIPPEMQAQFEQLKAQAEQAQEIVKQPSLEEVVEFLRNDRARGFVIEIETDSTIQPDEDAEKQRRIEFGEAVGGLLERIVPMAAQAPELVPFGGEMLKFISQGFRAGRPLEGAVEQLTQAMGARVQDAQQNPPPDPKVEAEKAKAEAVKEKAQVDIEVAREKARIAAEVAAQKQAMEMEKMKAEQQKQDAELAFLMEKLGIQREEMALEREANEQQHELGREAMHEKHNMSLEMMDHKARQERQNGGA